MVFRIVLHPDTEKDYTEAYIWYESRQLKLGEKFITAVRLTIESIANQPESYGRKGLKNFREARVFLFPYIIVYRVDTKKKEIYISSIHHSRKHPGRKYRKPRQ